VGMEPPEKFVRTEYMGFVIKISGRQRKFLVYDPNGSHVATVASMQTARNLILYLRNTCDYK
jgi:hypothetical protein